MTEEHKTEHKAHEEHKEEHKVEHKHKDNMWRYTTIALMVVVVLLLVVFLWKPGESSSTGTLSVATLNQIANKTVNFINENIISGGSGTAAVDLVSETSGILNVTVLYQGRQIPVYATTDGRYLILPGAGVIDMNAPIPASNETQQTQQPAQQNLTCNDLTKVDKPELDAFVVSNCPYGLQMQRILSPVVAFFGDKANIKIRYIGSVTSDGKNITSMHGDKEAVENLRQICIREEQSDKFWNYIACYIKKGDTDNCLTEAKIDKTKLNTCMSDTNKGVNYAKEDFALQNQYRVSGSPTLVLNGMVIDSDAERALATNMQINMRSADLWKSITCCGFSTEPSGCSQKLSSEPANTGFSETYSGGSATGSTGATCGS